VISCWIAWKIHHSRSRHRAGSIAALGSVYWLMRQRDDPVDAKAAAQDERDQIADTERREGARPSEDEERRG
jgi:hypothetical protein